MKELERKTPGKKRIGDKLRSYPVAIPFENTRKERERRISQDSNPHLAKVLRDPERLRIQEIDVAIFRYKEHLDSYMGMLYSERDNDYLAHIQAALTYGVDFGLERDYGKDIAFGIAIVIGDITYRDSIGKRGPTLKNETEENARVSFDNRTQAKIQETAEWLPKEFSERRRLRRKPKRTEEEYREILTKLEKDWPNPSVPLKHFLILASI
ncbi:MAG: hypothetical protein V1697_00840 [Candidatus Levyibacteriota bacterium]